MPSDDQAAPKGQDRRPCHVDVDVDVDVDDGDDGDDGDDDVDGLPFTKKFDPDGPPLTK